MSEARRAEFRKAQAEFRKAWAELGRVLKAKLLPAKDAPTEDTTQDRTTNTGNSTPRYFYGASKDLHPR